MMPPLPESRHHTPRLVGEFVLRVSRKVLRWCLMGWSAIIALASCTRSPASAPEEFQLDTCRLHAGDLILRLGAGLLSASFRAVASDSADYSHCGIIDYDSTCGVWIVWHAMESEALQVNGIFAQPLTAFIQESLSYQIYPMLLMDTLALNKMHRYIAAHIKGGALYKPFDVHFNLHDTTTLYCSEFAALAYCATDIPEYCATPTGHNILIPYVYYTLDDLRRLSSPR